MSSPYNSSRSSTPYRWMSDEDVEEEEDYRSSSPFDWPPPPPLYSAPISGQSGPKPTKVKCYFCHEEGLRCDCIDIIEKKIITGRKRKISPRSDVSPREAKKFCAKVTTKRTPLTQAVADNNRKEVETLISEKGIDINETDTEGYTPLTLSIYKNRKDIAELLIQSKNIEVNKMDSNGNIPLMIAIKKDRISLACKLLCKDADILAKDKNGRTPLDEIIALGRQDIVLISLSASDDEYRVQILKKAVFGQMRNSRIPKGNYQHNSYFLTLVHLNSLEMIKCCTQNHTAHQSGPLGRNSMTLAAEKNLDDIVRYLQTSERHHCYYNVDDRKETALSIALNNRNLDLAKFLLEKGASVGSATDLDASESRSSIANALIERNDMEALELLQNHRASRELGNVLLVMAVTRQNEQIVRLVLKNQPNVDEVDRKSGCTPLTAAIRHSSELFVSLLLEHKANVDKRDNFRQTPLTLAVILGKKQIVEILLDNKASINEVDGTGYTPVTTAVKLNSLDMIKLLRQRGADMNYEDSHGHTPLTLAVSLNSAEIYDYLLDECKVDVNLQGWFGSSALINAVLQKNAKLIEKLIAKEAYIEAVDWKGRTALVEAVNLQSLEIVKLLIDKCADVNFVELDVNWVSSSRLRGHTPLTKAIDVNNVDIVSYLLEHGADIERVNGFGNTPLLQAIINGNLAMIDFLAKRGATVITPSKMNVLGEVLKQNSVELMECLMKNCKDLVKPERIFTEACATLAFQIVDLYVDKMGMSFNVIDQDGYTPMTRSIEYKKTVAIEYLIGKKVDLNQIDGNGFTALTKAIDIDNNEIAKLLIEGGADVSKIDGRGVRPIAKAAEKEDVTLLKFYLTHDKRNKKEAQLLLECPVCYVALNTVEVCSTKCGHVFCKKCLLNVFKSSKSCPNCRAHVTRYTMRALYIYRN